MVNRKSEPALDGVTGGEDVNLLQLDHGLGRKRDFLEKIAAAAEEQGLAPTPVADDTKTETSSAPRNAIDLPVQKLLLETWERGLAQFYTTEDPLKREPQELADKVVQSALRELVAPEAVLFVPPDEFSKVRKELQELAEQLVKDAQKLANKHTQKTPVNEESLKRSLTRDLGARKFRDRHNALFHYPGIGKSAPETGLQPVGAITGSLGSVGPDHGNYRAKT